MGASRWNVSLAFEKSNLCWIIISAWKSSRDLQKVETSNRKQCLLWKTRLLWQSYWHSVWSWNVWHGIWYTEKIQNPEEGNKFQDSVKKCLPLKTSLLWLSRVDTQCWSFQIPPIASWGFHSSVQYNFPGFSLLLSLVVTI